MYANLSSFFPSKTQVRFNPNAFAFEVKRRSVLGKTHLRLKENVLAFCDERKDIFLCLFFGPEKSVFRLPVPR